jgi:hypothetical protein
MQLITNKRDTSNILLPMCMNLLLELLNMSIFITASLLKSKLLKTSVGGTDIKEKKGE